MQITCFNCKNIWEVPAKTLHAARRAYASGQKGYEFTCPNCGAKNVITGDEFQSYDWPQNVVPVTGSRAAPGPDGIEDLSNTEVDATEAPTNPVEAPRPGVWQKRGIVRVRGLEAHRDHSDWSEIMGEFSKGDRVTILDTWADGERTWVQLGPERWVNIEQGGEVAIELLDD
jgi:predicted RNA-binding Zn-ribbon protein involved in translation (DUF1610 family)